MEDMLRALQGTTIASTRPPAFIKLAPNDDGSSLPAAFFEHPDTYIKHIGPDGRIRSWGLYPYIPRGQQGAGYEDIPYPMMRKMMHQMTYAPLNRSSQLLRPEDQFMNAVLARRKRELKQVDLGDLTRRDYILRIHMPDIKTATGEDRIWRRFIVSGGMSLGVFQDKVLAPLMGWVRNFHAHILTDYRDGTQYGPKNSGAIDMMHVDASGYDSSTRTIMRGHVMAKVGDACQYEYDLGDHFRHDIILRPVQVLGGSGICPMENGKGTTLGPNTLRPSQIRHTCRTARTALRDLFHAHYTDRGWNKRSKFDPDYFDLAETTRAVMAALGTKLSYSRARRHSKCLLRQSAPCL
ncbi:hypothetical protein B0H13DRAFT_2064926 [Mycena leptocephala]|nr:hypothetical protein B0H13DRAFT_2064926 [Mycena leptocephala]